jgi:hypothetical protein
MTGTGYKAPASAKQFTDHISGTVYPYENIGNVKSCDGSRATIDTSGGTNSGKPAPDIVVYNFALPTIKDNARIDGVLVKINRQKAVYAGDIRDTYVRLRQGSSAYRGTWGSNYAKTGTNWPEKETGSAIYGDVDDTWGLNLTPAMVNDAGFGVLMRCQGTSSTWTIPSVDCINMAVVYTDPTYALGGNVATSALLGDTFTYQLNLWNSNGVHQGFDIPVSLALPSGCTLISQSGSSGSWFNPSTGKWNAKLAGGSATLTLTFRADTVGTKTINASVDGFSAYSSTQTTIINPTPNFNLALNSNNSVEISENIDLSVVVSGTVYNDETQHISLEIPDGLTLEGSTVVSTANMGVVVYSGGVISFNRASTSSYNFSFELKLTFSAWGMGSKVINAVESSIGTTATKTIAVVLTKNIQATGIKSQKAKAPTYNAVVNPTVVVALAAGTKSSTISSCDATAEIIGAYIGPVLLDRPHSAEGLKNTTSNTLIDDIYKGRENVGKKGDYSEDIPLTIRVPPADAVTFQGLAKLDEAVPINTNIVCADLDPLNHRGYAVIHKCIISKINALLYECDLSLKYLTRNLNPPIYIERKSQINKYNLKPLYSVELMNNTMALDSYFDITTDGTLTSKTISLTALKSFKLVSKNLISTPATIEYTWASNVLIGTERLIRVLDDDGKSVLEYLIYANATGTFANVSVYDGDGGVDTDDYEIDLSNGAAFSSITTLHIDNNMASILEEGASGVELFAESLALKPGNYQLEIDIRHTTSTSSTTTVDFNIDETHILNNEKAQYINQIVSSFPLKDKILQYTREAEDGQLYYYRHDETVSKYYTSPFVIYKGGVNITTATGASLLNNSYKADPLILTNGLTMVEFNFKLKSIFVYIYDPESEEGWVWDEKYRLLNMENIQIDYISQDKATVSCGGTTWTLWRGRRSVDIVHPEQDIYILGKKNTAWGDDGDGTGDEMSLVGDTQIPFNNLYYVLMYNSNENYGMQIIRPDYSPIYNTKIPRNAKTVIIPYKRNAKSYDLPAQLAMEWLNMYEQRIKITGK